MTYKQILQEGDTTEASKGFFVKDGRVLLVKPAGGDERYDIPGGKIKFGESREQGLYRECLEETNLKIKKAKFIGRDDEREKNYFIVSEWQGEISLQVEELEKYRWVTLETVSHYYLTKTAYKGFNDYLLKELYGRI